MAKKRAISDKPLEAIPKKITKTEINALPLARYEGKIHLITTEAAEISAINELKKETVLGFDTESRPSFKKGESYLPSLVQLASSQAVYLFQLNQLDGIKHLKQIFCDSTIHKVGIALHDDIKKLNEMSPFEARSFSDISDTTKKWGITNTGLRSLSAMFLNVRISKGAQVSNWAKKTLNHNQLIYAATDAWISRKLYLHLT